MHLRDFICYSSKSGLKRIVLAACFVVLPLLQACAPKPPVQQQPSTVITINAVGDVMMPGSIQKVVKKNKYDYDILFEKVAPFLGEADITFANLETPIDHKRKVRGYPAFNAHPSLMKSLKKSGVDVVSIANNHIMDAGVTGLTRTIENIDASGIVAIGAGQSKERTAEVKTIDVHGVKIAFLAYTYTSNNKLPPKKKNAPAVNLMRMNSDTDLAGVIEQVKAARQKADLVVLSLHWGIEYRDQPTTWQRLAAMDLIEAGADIILGHHPHVLQPIARYRATDGRRGLIAFSLGNFISSQHYGIEYGKKDHAKFHRGDGIMLRIIVVQRANRVDIAQVSYLPIWSHLEEVKKSKVYRPIILEKEIADLEALPERTKEQKTTLKLFNHRLKTITGRFSINAVK